MQTEQTLIEAAVASTVGRSTTKALDLSIPRLGFSGNLRNSSKSKLISIGQLIDNIAMKRDETEIEFGIVCLF